MKPDLSVIPARFPEPRTDRKGFTPKQRAEAFTRAGGRCEECNAKLMAKYEVDHRIALDHTGKHEPSNWRVLCVDCHKVKTASDIGISAHINRIHEKHGFKEPKRQARPKMQGRGFSRDLTKRFDGSVVKRSPKTRYRAERVGERSVHDEPGIHVSRPLEKEQ